MNPWVDSPSADWVLDVAEFSEDKPFLLIDVDGVLNAINGAQGNHAEKTYDIFKVGPYTIRFRHELFEWLYRLEEHYHLAWCTMWDERANIDLVPRLGIAELPYVPCFKGSDRWVEWQGVPLYSKVACIQAHLGNRSFAWIDDEIAKGELAWAAHRDDEVGPTYLLPIDARMGLMEHHVNKLIKWAEKIK